LVAIIVAIIVAIVIAIVIAVAITLLMRQSPGICDGLTPMTRLVFAARCTIQTHGCQNA
jgi:hypothetical protein